MRENVTRDQRRVLRANHLALGPYGIWAVLFILVPLVFVAYYAFTDVNFQFTLENIQRFFTATVTSCRTTAPPPRSAPTCSSSGVR